jgi:hypothetical protein
MRDSAGMFVACSFFAVGCFNPDGGPSGSATETGGTETSASVSSGPTSGATATTSGTSVEPTATTTSDGTTAGSTNTATDVTMESDSGSSSSTGETVPRECEDTVPAPGEVCFGDAAVMNAGDIGYSPRVGEVNGDGNVDVVYLYGDQIVVRLGDGTGMFGPEIPDETLGCDEMELADVDGDDILDHVCTWSAASELSVSINNGSGSFDLQDMPSTVGATPVELVAGDLNGDGNVDVVTIHGGSSGFLRVALSQGNGLFSLGDTISTSNLAGADVALGDFTGDGVDDVAFTTATGTAQVRISVNDGNGDFGQALEVNVTTSGAFGIAAGDVNADGDDDLAVANGDEVLSLLATGTASFEAAESLSIPADANAIRVAVTDVSNDGHADIIATYDNQTIVSVFQSNGDGTYAERIDFTIGSASDSLSTGDVNNDGIPDIVVGSTSAELVTVLISTP